MKPTPGVPSLQLHRLTSPTHRQSRRFYACLFLVFSLVWSVWQGSGCGPLAPPSEPGDERAIEFADDASAEPTLELVGDARGERAGQEPSGPDKGTPELTRDIPASRPEPTPDTIPEFRAESTREPVADTRDGGREALPEVSPEVSPEVLPEVSPDIKPPAQVKAVSLRASFLQNDLQSGLMERAVNSATTWVLEVVVPKGKSTFAFVYNGNNGPWGSSSGSAITGPLSAAASPLAIVVGQDTRMSFRVDLKSQKWFATPMFLPTTLELRGSWSGTSQTLPMKQRADGSFSAEFPVKRGPFTFRFFGARPGVVVSYGSKFSPHRIFPAGGVALAAAGDVVSQAPVDGQYLVTFSPTTLRWQVQAVSTSGVAAWNAHVASIQSEPDPIKRNSATRTWLQERGARGGLPLRDGADVLFVVEWKTRAPVYLAGSFNQWSDSAAPMQNLTGTDFHYRKVTLAAGHHEYKFVDSSSPKQWILDPNNTAIVYSGLGPNSVLQVGAAGKHRIHWHRKVQATQLNNTRDVFVYLPPGYEQNVQARYPVIYMHDGQNLFDPKAINGGWGVALEMDKLIAQKSIQPAIIVGVANTPGRLSEYTHVQDRIGGQLTGGKAKDYADFLLRDLKPWIDGLYRTLPDHRNTGTMGSSLGGLVALWLGSQYPDAFFRIGAISSTFGWGKIGATNQTLLELVDSGSWWNFVVYLDSGSPNDNFAETIKMRDLLEKKGYLHNLNLAHWTETGASHNEAAWRKRLSKPLTFLLGWK